MKIGDRIRYFADSDIPPYVRRLHRMGFKVVVDGLRKEIVIIGARESAEKYSMRLKQAMIKNHLSVKDLAEKCNVTYQTAESWFLGRRKPYKKTRLMIEDLFGVKP